MHKNISPVHMSYGLLPLSCCEVVLSHARRLQLYRVAFQVHGWLMCLAWGALIPIAVVIATFRTVRGTGTWWVHLHSVFNNLGFLVSLAGVAVGVYLDPGEGGLVWQHKIIGITVNVLALVQVKCNFLLLSKHCDDVTATSINGKLFHCCSCLGWCTKLLMPTKSSLCKELLMPTKKSLCTLCFLFAECLQRVQAMFLIPFYSSDDSCALAGIDACTLSHQSSC